MKRDTLQLVGAFGTNKVMTAEVSRLCAAARLPRQAAPGKAGTGGIVYPFDADLAAVLLGYHRTSSRVLWDLYESGARRLEPLYDELVRDISADCTRWLPKGRVGISIRARNVDAFGASSRQLVGAVKSALVDGTAQHGGELYVEPETPDILFTARMHDERVTVSIDLAGMAMNRRGYRTVKVEAPLREDLASVLVMLTRWDARAEPLVDPMAGSGTIAIEAALMGRAAPLRHGRVELPTHLPPFRDLQPREGDLFPATEPVVFAGELHTPSVSALRTHVEQAGCQKEVETHHGDFRDLSKERLFAALEKRGADTRRGVILTNPPYGERISTGDEPRLYRDFGDWCGQFRGWRVGVLCAHREFEHSFGGRARVKKPLRNGPQSAYFYLFDL